MRTISIRVHNNQTLEVFVEKRKDSFELWIVGLVSGCRMILDHHLTHDDLEARLAYAKPGDLVWREAVPVDIPTKKHQGAIEGEKTIKQGTFWDFQKLQQSVVGHLGAIALLPLDRKESNAAKKTLFGQWTDGVVTLIIEPNNKLGWSCADRHHPLNVGERIDGHAPDWWNFAMWRLHLMNDEHKCGTHVGVLRVDERELHFEGGQRDSLVRIFRRDK